MLCKSLENNEGVSQRAHKVCTGHALYGDSAMVFSLRFDNPISRPEAMPLGTYSYCRPAC